MIARKKHVLIVEDNTFLSRILVRALTAQKLKVTVAQNGEEAIAIIDDDTPDLLLLDLLLPRVDGFGVLEHRKQKSMTFPVIVCTNISDKVSKDRCKKLGTKEYLVKSDIDDEQLLPVLTEALQGR